MNTEKPSGSHGTAQGGFFCGVSVLLRRLSCRLLSDYLY